MERFAKRKILVFDYLNCYRVFYKEDSGRIYHVCDLRTKAPNFIALEVKRWYDNRKRKGKFYILITDGDLVMPLIDEVQHKMYFDTINAAYEWLDSHSLRECAKYEVIEEKDEADN